jgi:hypothetical protein
MDPAEEDHDRILLVAAAAGHSPAEANPVLPVAASADIAAENMTGFEPVHDNATTTEPWNVSPRETQTTLTANVSSAFCDRVTAYTRSAHQ